MSAIEYVKLPCGCDAEIEDTDSQLENGITWFCLKWVKEACPHTDSDYKKRSACMNIEVLKKILGGYEVHFHVIRPTISIDGSPPPANDKFVLFVSDEPPGSLTSNVLQLLDSRDLASSINHQGEENFLNAIFLFLTLSGYEVFVNDSLYVANEPYKRDQN